MNTSVKMRRLNRTFITAMWLCVGLLGVAAVAQGWGGDFNHYWSGSRTLLDGGDPYQALYRYPQVIQYSNEQYHPLPWVGLFFVPLALLPYPVAVRAWAIVNIVLLTISLRAILRLGQDVLQPWQSALIGVATIWLAARCVYAGQTTILITTVVLLGMIELQKGQSLKAGVYLSLMLFKPWVSVGAAIGIAAITARRHGWKFFVGLGIAAIAGVLITSILWPQWWNSYFHVDFSQAYGVKVAGQFVIYWPVATLFDLAKYVWKWPLDAVQVAWLWAVLGLAVLALGVMVVYRWWLRQLDDLVLMGVATLLIFMIIPYVRYYDYCFLSIYFVGLFIGGKRSQWLRPWLIFAAVLVGVALALNVMPEPWAYQLLFALYAVSWLLVGPRFSTTPVKDAVVRVAG